MTNVALVPAIRNTRTEVLAESILPIQGTQQPSGIGSQVPTIKPSRDLCVRVKCQGGLADWFDIAVFSDKDLLNKPFYIRELRHFFWSPIHSNPDLLHNPG